MSGAELIAQERKRQVNDEGWTSMHDNQHKNGELASVAVCYILNAVYNFNQIEHRPGVWWPNNWDVKFWKPRDQISDLVRAGALIAAEIDRLQRL
jgi:hypothetical protein